MSKNFKHSLTVAFLAVMTVCFMIAIMFSFQPVRGGLDKDNYIITLDNLSVVSGAGTSWPNRTRVVYEDGYLKLVSKYTNVDGVVNNPGKDKDNDGDGFTLDLFSEGVGNFSWDDYRYVQIKFKRINCDNSRMQFYSFNRVVDADGNITAKTVAERGFAVEDIDEKWTILTLDLWELNSGKESVMFTDVATGRTTTTKYTSISSEFEYDFDMLRINFGRGLFLPNKEVSVEYIGFFADKDEALSYKGEAQTRLNSAVSKLKDKNTVLNSLFGDARNEEMAILEVSEQISKVALVGSEVTSYTYTPATVSEKGKVEFSVQLQSAGLKKDVNDLVMYIDKVPEEPIMFRFNNQEMIDNLNPSDVTMTLEDGVMKMVKLDPEWEDGFFFTFDTPGIIDPFILQNYSYIKLKFKPMQVSGKYQIYFMQDGGYGTDGNLCRSFIVNWDTEQWLTVIIDTSKTDGAVEIYNLETGVTSYENCYNGNWKTDFELEPFEGVSENFRFTFGRKDNLERTTYIEYISFFPTLEMAREYDEDGEKFKSDSISKLNLSQSKELVVDYGNALSEKDAVEHADNIVTNLISGNCGVDITPVKYVSAGYEKNGYLKFTAKIFNYDLEKEVLTQELTMTIKNMKSSQSVLWKYNNKQFIDELTAIDADITFSNDSLSISPKGEKGGFAYTVPFGDRFNSNGYSYVKLGYSVNADTPVTLNFSGDNFKLGIDAKLKANSNETIISLSTLKQYYFGEGTEVLDLIIKGQSNGGFKTFEFKVSNDVTLDYVRFCTDLATAKIIEGNSLSEETLNNFILSKVKNENVNLDALKISTEYSINVLDGFAEMLIERNAKSLLENEITIKSIKYGQLIEPTAESYGKLEYTVTFAVGPISNYAEKTLSGVLTIGKRPPSELPDTDDTVETYKELSHEFFGSNELYGSDYLYMTNDLADIPNSFELWLKLDVNESGREHVILSNQGIYLSVLGDGNIKVAFSGSSHSTNNINMFDDEWHHLAVVRDAGKNKILVYIDGVEKASWSGATSGSAEDKSAMSFGAQSVDLLGRVTPNDIILDTANKTASGVLIENDSICITVSSGTGLSVDFYNKHVYNYTENILRYVRVVDDVVNYRLFIYTADSVENLITAHEIVYNIEGDCKQAVYGGTWSTGSKYLNGEFNLNGGYKIIANETGLEKLTLNGKAFASFTVCNWQAVKTIYFDGEKGGISMTGKMGEVLIWKNARSQEQIKKDMNAFYSGNETGLLAHYKLDYSEIKADRSIVYKDYSNNANDLKIYAIGYFRTNIKDINVGNTMVTIPDVQNHSTTEHELNDVISKWIIENIETKNIISTFSVGDITQNATSTEWKWVYGSYSILNNLMPFTIALGNHDYPTLTGRGAGSRDCSIYNSFWQYDEYKDINAQWGGFGVFEEGKMENCYILFESKLNGEESNDKPIKFILFALEYGPRDEVLEWVNIILKKYSDRNAILTTHSFKATNNMFSGEIDGHKDTFSADFARDSSVNEAPDIIDKVINKNDNVIAVYNGHLGASDLSYSRRTIQTNSGTDVQCTIVDTSAAGKFFPSQCCVIGLTRYTDDGTTFGYLYSPLENAYFCTDTIQRYQLDFIENRG